MSEPVDFEEIFCTLCALLDAIEDAVNNNDFARVEKLVRGRFDLIEQHGLTVKIVGETSEEKH